MKARLIKLIFVASLMVGVLGVTGVAYATVTLNATSVTSDVALNLTGGALSTWSLSAGALTINSGTNAALTLDSSGTGAVNLATGAAAKTIIIGNETSTTSVEIDSGTGAINIGNAIAKTINIGNATGATAVNIDVGTGDFTLDGAAAATITIGAAAGTGDITLGSSTAAQSVLIGNGVNAGAQIVSIANGATAANSTVNVLSGVGTAGAGILNLANNTRVTTVDIADIAPAAARTITIAGGDSAQDDTVDIVPDAPSAGTQTVNVLTGTATGGTQVLNLMTGTGGTKDINIGSAAVDDIVLVTDNTAANDVAITGGLTVTSGATHNSFTVTSSADSETAATITGNSVDTGTVLSVSGTGLTTGNLVTLTGTSTAVADTAAGISQVVLATTNAQATAAQTLGGGVNALRVNFNQNPAIAGNTENVVMIQNQVTANTTDIAIASLLLLDNADTATGGSTAVTDALKITNSGNISAGIVNAINIDDADITTDIVLQNDETIDNNTDGTVTITAPTTSLSGDLTVTGGDINVQGEASTISIIDNTASAFLLEDGDGTNLDYILIGTLDGAETMVFGHSTVDSITFTTDGTGTGEIVLPDGSIGEDELAASLVFDDGDLLDFGTFVTDATEGLMLPAHATDCSAATAEGQVCWQESTAALYIGDGATAGIVGPSTSGEVTWTDNHIFTLAGDEDIAISHDLGAIANILNITATPNGTDFAVQAIKIDQAASGNANGLDAAIEIDNSDDSAAITAGILFTSAGGAITTAINASATQIGTALQVDANDIVGTTGLINYTNFDVDAAGGITTADDVVLSSGKITVDTVLDETSYVKRNQATSTSPAFEIEITDTGTGDTGSALLIDNNGTGNGMGIEVVHNGDLAALNISADAARTGNVINIPMANMLAETAIDISGAATGTNGEGIIHVDVTGVLAGNAIRVDSTGANAATGQLIYATSSGQQAGATNGIVAYFTDTGTATGTSYTVYIASTENEALYVDTGEVLFDEKLTISGGGAAITGNSTLVGTFTVGVDDTGHDVQLFGATASAHLLWDESDDDLELAGSAGFKEDAQTLTADNNSDAGSTIPDGKRAAVVSGVTTDLNDWIVLPAIANVPIGHTIRIAANAGANFEMRTPAASDTTINNVDADGGAAEYLVTNTDVVVVTKHTTTGWIAVSYTNLGAVRTAVVPD